MAEDTENCRLTKTAALAYAKASRDLAEKQRKAGDLENHKMNIWIAENYERGANNGTFYE